MTIRFSITREEFIIWYGSLIDNPKYKGDGDTVNEKLIESESTNLRIGEKIVLRDDVSFFGITFLDEYLRQLGTNQNGTPPISLEYLGFIGPNQTHNLIAVGFDKQAGKTYVGTPKLNHIDGRFIRRFIRRDYMHLLPRETQAHIARVESKEIQIAGDLIRAMFRRQIE